MGTTVNIETVINNICGIILIPTCHKILANVLLAKVTSYVEKIFRHSYWGFSQNRSASDQMFTLKQILGQTGNSAIQRIQFFRFLKIFDSVKRSKIYEIFGITRSS